MNRQRGWHLHCSFLDYTDFIGLSASCLYVYCQLIGIRQYASRLFPANYFTRFINLAQKKQPILAFAETGTIAETS